MMKTNLALGKLMKDACNSGPEASGSAGQIMRAMGNALLNGHEIFVLHEVYGPAQDCRFEDRHEMQLLYLPLLHRIARFL